MRLKCITINTDASFCPKSKANGWAFRIKGDSISINTSGIFKCKVHNSTEAETYCIINAMHTLSRFMRINDFYSKYVIVNTDSTRSIEKLESNPTRIRKHHNDKTRKYFEVIKSITDRCEILQFRHVKAHSGIGDNRSKANEWCDAQSKMQMRRHRKIIKAIKRGNNH